MALFEALADATGNAKWRTAADECFAWIEKGPLSDWNWDAQFEDILPLPPYQGLTKHNAVEVMLQLLKRRGGDPAARATARDILRWSEDQFVFWATVKYCREVCSPDRLKGFLMTTWHFTLQQWEKKNLEAVDQVGAVIAGERNG